MTEHLRDQLSAFLDGELPRPEVELLLRRLAGNDELQIALSRYVVIGECLRNAPGQSVTRGFAGRVRAAVAAEGTRKGVDRVRSLGPWLRPVGGLAIAATVATVAILGLQRTQQLDPAVTPAVVASIVSSSHCDWWARDRRSAELHGAGTEHRRSGDAGGTSDELRRGA